MKNTDQTIEVKMPDFPISVQELVSKLIDNPGGFPVVFIDDGGQVLNYKSIGIGKDAVMIALSKVESDFVLSTVEDEKDGA